jgi:hypothetical protein
LYFLHGASILLFSVVTAFAESTPDPKPSVRPENNNDNDDDDDDDDDNGDNQQPQTAPSHCNTVSGSGSCCDVSYCIHSNNDDNDNQKDHSDHDKHFFRGHNKEMPSIPQMNFATTATNGTTANVTVPICNGIVGGLCLDPNTHTIIP